MRQGACCSTQLQYATEWLDKHSSVTASAAFHMPCRSLNTLPCLHPSTARQCRLDASDLLYRGPTVRSIVVTNSVDAVRQQGVVAGGKQGLRVAGCLPGSNGRDVVARVLVARLGGLEGEKREDNLKHRSSEVKRGWVGGYVCVSGCQTTD